MARPSRKDEILQAALACFTEHGVDATTIAVSYTHLDVYKRQ